MGNRWLHRTVLIFALALAGVGCAPGERQNSASSLPAIAPGPPAHPPGGGSSGSIDPVPARQVVSGGVVNSRRQSAVVGISKQQSVLSSSSFRMIGNLQGALYTNP
jgi:hypothetical protein